MNAAELLASLGATADEVAQSLRDRGIVGRRAVARQCPLAELLSRECPDVQHGPWVVGMVLAFLDKRSAFDPDTSFELPDGALEFRLAFDAGAYPELDADAVVTS
jgi:hypothetical protein